MNKPVRIYPAAPKVDSDLVVNGPDFVGIGAMKSGTTWLASLIFQHPQFYVEASIVPLLKKDATQHRSPKERHFFDRTHVSFSDADAEEYRRWFPRPKGRITGEITPRYIYDFWVPEQLKLAAPDTRLLVLLRDPIERFKSGCAHAGNLEPQTFRDHFFRGFCYQQLMRWLQHFPRSSFLIIQYEQLVQQPEYWFKDVCRFVGLDDSYVPPREQIGHRVNVRKNKQQLPEKLSRTLAESYHEDMHNLASAFPEIDLSLWQV